MVIHYYKHCAIIILDVLPDSSPEKTQEARTWAKGRELLMPKPPPQLFIDILILLYKRN